MWDHRTVEMLTTDEWLALYRTWKIGRDSLLESPDEPERLVAHRSTDGIDKVFAGLFAAEIEM